MKLILFILRLCAHASHVAHRSNSMKIKNVGCDCDIDARRLTYFLCFDIVVVALVIDEFRTEERSSLERARRTISLRESAAFFFYAEKRRNQNQFIQFRVQGSEFEGPSGLYLIVLHCLRVIDFVAVRNMAWRPWCQH